MKKLLAVLVGAFGLAWALSRRDDGATTTRTTWEQATDPV